MEEEWPQYKCHKEVGALLISSVSGNRIEFEDARYAGLTFDNKFMDQYQPSVGGYIVKYIDGYKAYSPAAAFENGYTLMGGSK